MTAKTATFRNGQKVTIDIMGELQPARLTSTYGDGFYFATLADGTYTGKIAESRIAAVPTLRHGDHVVIGDARRAKNHSVTSLSGYGNQYEDYTGPNGMSRYLRALERNGKGVWLNAEATVISAYREAPVKRIPVQSGDIVWFDSATPGEGGWYRIALPGQRDGDHCQLVRA